MKKRLITILCVVLAMGIITVGCQKQAKNESDEKWWETVPATMSDSPDISEQMTTVTDIEIKNSDEFEAVPSDTVVAESLSGSELKLDEPVGENVTVSVPVAGATFQLPAGWTSYKATRKVHTFVSADGNMFLNVVTGVGYVPNVAQGTEGFLKDIVLENISDMPLFSHGFEGIGSNISLLSEGFTLAPNVFTDGEWFEPAYMRATLTGTMFDEYGGLVECPAFDSMYYAYNIPANGTGVIFIVSTDPALGQDVKPVMEMIVATLSAYSEPLDAMNLEYTTFDFEEIGIAFDLPSAFVVSEHNGNYKIAIPNDPSNPLNDFQVLIFPNYEGALDYMGVAEFLTENRFYELFFDGMRVADDMSERYSLSHIREFSRRWGLPEGQVWSAFEFSSYALLEPDERGYLPDNGRGNFEVTLMRSGDMKLLLVVNSPMNMVGLKEDLIDHMNDTFVLNKGY